MNSTILTPFGRRLHEGLREMTAEFEISEDHKLGNLLDKVYTIKTPGFVVPEDAREIIRDFARDYLPAVVRTTFIFEPND